MAQLTEGLCGIHEALDSVFSTAWNPVQRHTPVIQRTGSPGSPSAPYWVLSQPHPWEHLLSEQQQQTDKEPWELTMLFLQLLWVLNYFRKKRYFRVLVLIHCRLESPENLVAKWSCHWALPQKNMTKSAGNPKCSPQRCPILSPSVAQWLSSLQSSDRFTGEPEFWLHYFHRKCFSIPENQFTRVSLQPDFFSSGLCLCACFLSWELPSPRGHLTYGAGETRAAGREFLLLELVFT